MGRRRPLRRPDLPPPTTNIANTVAMADHRMTYRRRQPYNTVSNKVRTIRTPGGDHRLLNTKKKGTNPKCGDCGSKLAGIPALRPREEDRLALLRRQPLRQLRQGPRHPRLPDRGAEDCQEGHARSREEEQEVDVVLLRRSSDGMIMASDLASRKRHSTTLLCEQSLRLRFVASGEIPES